MEALMMQTEGRQGLLARQWAGYAGGHGDRRNLLVHALTVPVFLLGTVALAAAPFSSAWLALAGPAAMMAAIGIQGRAHQRETQRPAPFEGAADAIVRIFVEQWVTFPRFVLSGGFGRAWRQGR
jgi:hypothetical protein